MKSIQQTRNELENNLKGFNTDINNFIDLLYQRLNDKDCSQLKLLFNGYKLEGFNLGVSLAQKEILDKLEILYKKYYDALINGKEVKFAMFYIELKQSLEVKE